MKIWILGAPDPEMVAIEQLLVAANQPVAYATGDDGKRVSPAAAYQPLSAALAANCGPARAGERVSDAQALYPALEEIEVVLVECGLPHEIGAVTIAGRVDHHRPGDPGYGKPPAEYWSASSLGQVAAMLGVAPTPELRMTAAADHCLAAAYQGECPGVDPDALMAWRVASRAVFQRRPVADILRDVEAAIAVLRAAPRDEHGVAQLATPVPECPEAAARTGIAFSVELTEKGARKRVLQAATPAQVVAFMAAQRAAGREPYGDPARGFAGVSL